MAITTVGTLVNSYVTSSQSTVSLTTVNVGDCVVAELTILANIQITGVSSSHVTWREVAGPLYNSTLVATTHKWVGTVTAVSTANVTLTFSAAIGSNVLQRTITQLSAGLGSSCQWFSFAGSQTNASSTTMAYPPLSATYANLGYTPSGGAPIAYVGYALGLNAGSAGSTPGFTYTLDTIVAPLAVDTNVALNSTPAPTASQSPAAVSYATAVLLMPVPITAPGGDFDLTNWYLTLPTDDGSGAAATVHQPSLNTYTDTNFDLDGSGRMVMTAPVNGFTTSGSTATRCELREQQGGSNAAWDMSTTTRSLTVSGFYDATSITGGSNPRQEQIIGQIHSTGGTPPLYLSMNFSTTPTELQVFQDSNGSIGNLITGFTPSTRIAYRIEVVGGNVNVYGVAGDETNLPGTPQFSLPHTGFTETTGCYLKAGSYNKTDTGTGATGQAVATVAYLHLLQGPAVTVSDTVGLSGAVTRAAQVFTRTLSSAVYPSSSLFPSSTLFPGSGADTMGLSDSMSGAGTARTVTDAVGLSDVVTRAAQSRTRTVADTFGAADVVSGRVRSVSDTVTLPDAVTRSMSRWQRGINDAGGEFGDPADGGTLPGVYGVDYQYDSAATLTYLAGRGHTIVRLPFLWERIQPTLGGALDPTELGRLQAYVSRAGTAGVRVILDVHNYARYSPPPGSTTYVLGDGHLSQTHIADLWQRLSAAFKGNPGIAGYGLMNEPHDVLAVAGTYSGTVRYNWDDGTVQGWTGDTATATNVSNKLRLTGTATAGGFWDMRKDDNGTVSGGNTPTGNVLTATVTLAASSPAGTWQCLLQWQTSGPSFQWVTTSSNVYVRTDTGATVAALVPGVAVQVYAVFSSNIVTPNKFAIQIQSSNPSAGTVTADIDNYSQGTLSGYVSTVQQWEQTAQACVTAIRGNGDNTMVMVSTYPWAEPNAAAVHPTAWIVDPAGAGLVRYEGHIYFDDDISGRYLNSFAAETSLAAGEGYPSVQARTAARLSQFTAWLSNHGVLGYLGEVGWPNGSDAASWNAVGAAFYSALANLDVWVTYWSTGEGWGTSSSTYPMVAYMQAGSGLPVSVANAQAPTIEALPGTGMTRSVADSLGLSDSIGRVSGPRSVTIGDTVGLSDSVTRASRSLTRAVSDTVGLSGAVTRAAQVFTRTLSNAVYPSSSLFPSSTLFPGTGGPDTVGLSDVQTRAALNLAHNLADAVGAADSIARAPQTVARSLPDTAGLADTVGRSPRGFTRSAADTMGVSDVAARSAQPRSRTISDTAGLSDTVIRGAQAFTRSLSNAVYPGLSLFPGSTQFPESEFDTVGLSDVQVRAAPGSGRTISDTVGLSDTVTRAAQVFTRTLVDVVPAIDTVILGLVFSVADRIGLADTQTRAPRTFTAALSDSAGLADSQGRSTQAFARALSDTVGVFDSQGRPAQSFTRTVADTLGFVDTQGRAGQPLARSITDTLRLADVKSRTGQAFSRSFADVLGFVDNQARAALNLARAISGALGLSDAALQGRVFVRAIADGMGLSDSQASSARLSIRAVADTAGLVDTQSVLSSSGLTTTDSVGLVDAAAPHGIASRSVLDGVAAADVVAAAEHLARSAVDSLGLADSVAKRTGATSAVDRLRLVDETTAHLVMLPLGIGVPAVVGVLATGLGPDGANAPYIAY